MKPWSVLLAPLVLLGCTSPVAGGDHTGAAAGDDSAPPSDSGETGETGETADTQGADTGWPALLVNELMAQNTSTVADDQGIYADWIELYNPTAEDVDLAGWSLTDDLTDPGRSTLPSLVLAAGEHRLLWADGAPEQGADHLAFSLDNDGEALGLYAPDGRAIDGLRFGNQTDDVSLARSPDGGQSWVLASPATPGAPNGG